MSKLLNKKRISAQKGFTLTEVLVGIMVLVIAVVSATNLLVSMIQSNIANTNTLKAYYLSQEGLEAFRNMRDTHFMYNVDYRGDGVNLWGDEKGFSVGGDYSVNLKENPGGVRGSVTDRTQVNIYSTWKFGESVVEGVSEVDGNKFNRVCNVKPLKDANDIIEVTCTTSWEDKGDTREVSLSTILTDWKNE